MALRGFLLTWGIVLVGSLHLFAFQPEPQPFNWKELPPQYLLRHFTTDDGLPVNSVNGMVQDDDGYLYLSTYDGLVKYDGYEFYTYTVGNTDGITTNRIAGILHTEENDLWLLNANGSVTRKTGSVFKTYSGSDLPGETIRIVEGTDGQIWISTSEGIAWLDESTEQFIHVDTPMLQSRTGVLGRTLNDDVMGINEAGFFRWHNNEAELLLPTRGMPIPYEGVHQLKQLQPGYLWAVGDNGVFRYNLSTKAVDFEFTPDIEITFWSIDKRSDDEYILTSTQGFYLFNNEKKSVRKLSLPINSNIIRTSLAFSWNNQELLVGDDEVIVGDRKIFDISNLRFGFIDNENSLWMGTRASGIYQIRKSQFSNIEPEQVSGLDNIYSIIQDNEGAIWAGSFSNGIYRFSEQGVTNWNSSNSNLITDICRFLYEDANGNIYAGVYNEGLWVYENGRWGNMEGFEELLEDDPPTIEAMHRKGDQLFIGSFNSLVVWEDNEFRFYHDDRPRELSGIQVFKENNRGALFVGTISNGMSRLYQDKITTYSAGNGALNSNSVRDIFVQSEDTIWVATENLGLNRLVLDGSGNVVSTEAITQKDGLSHNSLHRIIEDSAGYFWLSSNGGIMRISKRNLNAYASGNITDLNVLSFDERDGMINPEANGGVQSAGILTSHGRLWFPNQQGITITEPGNVANEQVLTTPEPVLESIELEDTLLHIQNHDKITIPNNHRDLRIHFSAPNFAYQDRINFSYKLENVNPTWQSAGQFRQAVLTNIPPGEHNFTLVTQRIGREPVESSVIIHVPYKFHETNWFYILLIAVGMGLVFAGFRYRTRFLRQREEQLQQRVDEQTEQLKEAAEQKSRFFTGITHELKTPLSLIVGPLNDMMSDSEIINDTIISDRITLMRRNASRLKDLVNRLLDVSKLNAGELSLTIEPVDIELLTKRIGAKFEHSFSKKNIRFSIEADKQIPELYLDVSAWEDICTNLLSNALKFTSENGEVLVKIHANNSNVEISFKDSGLGIPEEEQPYIFDQYYQGDSSISKAGGTGIGLALVKGLVERMGGQIALNTDLEKGTEFIITLKKGTGHIDSADKILENKRPLDREFIPPSYITEDVEHEVRDEQTNESFYKVLLVEDNEDFRKYLDNVIQREYQVTTASNGQEGLEKLTHYQPDIIVSDIMMPEMDGYEMMKKIRELKAFRHIPFIFLSAKDSPYDIEVGLNSGADIYLTKPVENNVLLTQIKVLLRREEYLRDSEKDAESSDGPFVQKVRKIIQRHLGNPDLNTKLIADSLSVSRSTLYRRWNKDSEETISQAINSMRLNEALRLIKEDGLTISEAAYATGYNHLTYFSRVFKKVYGVTAREYIKKDVDNNHSNS